MSSALRQVVWLSLLLIWLPACSATNSPTATEVLNHGQCRGVAAGVSLVATGDLSRIRGGLLSISPPPPVPATPGSLLIAISRGPQPTPGYALSLSEVVTNGAVAVIHLQWGQPAPGTVQAQVMTHPCVVVEIPSANLRELRAVDQAGNEIGSIKLPGG